MSLKKCDLTWRYLIKKATRDDLIAKKKVLLSDKTQVKLKEKDRAADDFIAFRQTLPFNKENILFLEDHDETETEQTVAEVKKEFVEILTGFEDVLHVEATVQLYTFDILVYFLLVNKGKESLNDVSIELSVSSNLVILESPQSITLNGKESQKLRACLKITATDLSTLFGQISYSDKSGKTSYINLNSLQVDFVVFA